VTGNATNYKNSPDDNPICSTRDEISQPLGHFHHEPPLITTNCFQTVSMTILFQSSQLIPTPHDYFLFVCEQTRSPMYENTHSAERRLIQTDKTERGTRH